MTPAFRIVAAGRDITAVTRDRFLELTVTDKPGLEADKCVIRLDDRDGAIELPPSGARLDVDLGFVEQGLARMGAYTVDEIATDGPPATVTISGRSADMGAALKAPKTRSWHGVTLGALVSAIAAEHALEPQVDPALTDVRLPHVDQTEESDLNLLTRLAERWEDAVVKPAAGRLVFAPRQALAAAGGPVIAIARSAVTNWRFNWADRSAYVAVAGRWYDAASGAQQMARAGAATGEPVYTLPEIYPDAATARNAAETRLRALQRASGTARLTLAVGQPALAAEAPVHLSGFGPRRDGAWLATSVTHTLRDSDGYTTGVDLDTITPDWPRASAPPA